MIQYLLENYVPFYQFLDKTEIYKLLIVHKNYPNNISEQDWMEIFKSHHNEISIKEYAKSINLIHSKNHVTSIDKQIHKGDKKLYEYLFIHQ